MSKKNNKGLFTFLMGAAAGATALFLSKKENRDKAKETVDQVSDKAQTLKKELEENPEAVVAEVKSSVKQKAQQAVKAVKSKFKKNQTEE